MSSVAQIASDRQYIVGLASAYTTYYSYVTAQAAGITLSAGNSSALVYTGDVLMTVTNGPLGAIPGGRVDLPGPLWIVQLASTQAYYPLATAITQAFTLSAANANAPVYVAEAFQQVTGP